MHTAIVVLAALALALTALRIGVALFGPGLKYRLGDAPACPLDSPYFQSLVSALSQSELQSGNRIDVLENGENFYPAELAAIAAAQRTVTLEAYIFHRGDISSRFVQALAERARAGVAVKLTLDYIGSFTTPMSYLRDLTAAGGRVVWYHSLRPDLLLQIDNRTHRELLIVDGRVGFIGGAGIADWWARDGIKGKRWRDTVMRVEGPAVAGLQSVFAQNWLRVTGEILCGEGYFHFPKARDGALAMTIGSTPAAGSTQARVLFQTLFESAQKCVYISSPYFLPDSGARRALIRGVRERGVKVIVLTPGDNNDQRLTRAASRQLYGSLLKHGVRIFEYRPSMIHVKALMVDDCWAVVGSTNFDYRSFDINDEVNLALLDAGLTRTLADNFRRDLANAREVTYEEWSRRSRYRIADRLGWLLERQE